MKQYFMAFTAILLLGAFAYRFFSNDIDTTHLGLTAGIPVGPTIVPDGGTFRRPVAVTMELGAGATEIRYTKDGEAPSCGSGIVYDGLFTITHTTSVRAVDCGMGGQSMEVQTDFIIKTSSKGGGQTPDRTDVPYGPICEDDSSVCPPDAPVPIGISNPLLPPVFGNVLANGITALTIDLSFGATGNEVVLLQWFLIMQRTGPIAERLAVSGATGYFGLLTADALREFQESRGIAPASGYLGPITRGEINALMGWLPSAQY